MFFEEKLFLSILVLFIVPHLVINKGAEGGAGIFEISDTEWHMIGK